MFPYLIIGTTYGFAAAVQPGPLQTYLISRMLSVGWRRTIAATFAPLISDGPIALLALFVLQGMPAGVERFLHLGGGIFVLYLAYGAFRTWQKTDANRAPEERANGRGVLDAVVVNFLNPSPYLGWSLVTGPLFLKGWRETPGNGIGLLVAFYGTLIVTMIGILLLLTTVKKFGPRINRILIGISAIALAGFGIYQLWLVV